MLSKLPQLTGRVTSIAEHNPAMRNFATNLERMLVAILERDLSVAKDAYLAIGTLMLDPEPLDAPPAAAPASKQVASESSSSGSTSRSSNTTSATCPKCKAKLTISHQ
jgi:hypothetical protein